MTDRERQDTRVPPADPWLALVELLAETDALRDHREAEAAREADEPDPLGDLRPL